MKIIGLTGSIGMGKSVTTSLLRILKIPVHDSDAAVHQMMAPGGAAFDEVIKAFPKAYDKRANRIDRAALGKIVFADADARKKLEGIIHPHVWASQREFIRKCRRSGAKNAVLDIPLLYETGGEKKCDAVIVATAPAFLQRQRVLKRPGMSDEKFRSILKSQIPDSEKRRRADFVIHTGMGRSFTLKALRRIFKLKS